ncbi:hypothetical protein GCM10025857_24840 [Alicyclobacillus contaminans]|nr:hypothetical protein GCM10025857_24840 [Alicyclobacillus contaminans]
MHTFHGSLWYYIVYCPDLTYLILAESMSIDQKEAGNAEQRAKSGLLAKNAGGKLAPGNGSGPAL